MILKFHGVLHAIRRCHNRQNRKGVPSPDFKCFSLFILGGAVSISSTSLDAKDSNIKVNGALSDSFVAALTDILTADKIDYDEDACHVRGKPWNFHRF